MIYYIPILMAVKSKKEGYFMGRESFKQVFAPSAKEVQKQCSKHRKAAWTWFLLTLALIAGVGIALYLLLGKYGEAISHPLVNKITLTLIGLDIVAVIAATIATRYHNTKVERFEWELKNEYIILDPWSKARYRNYNL